MELRSRSSSRGKTYAESSDGDDLSPDSDYSDQYVDENIEAEELLVSNAVLESDVGKLKGKVKEAEEQLGEEMVIETNDEELVEEIVVETDDGEQKEIDLAEVENKKIKKRKKRKERPILLWEVWEEENKKWLDQHMTMDVDLDSLNEVIAETADAPPDLVMPLMRYQREWLAWALKQEESASKGGVLADEMGMGKTVQAIALVLAKRAICRGIGDAGGLSTGPSTALPVVKATLVICPLVAVNQWVSEIDRFTAKGSNKVLSYYGPNKGKTLHQFSEYDFVITTYGIIETQYRTKVMPPKDRCQWCGKMFYEDKLKIHLRHHCGPGAVKTDKQSKQQKKGGKLDPRFSVSKMKGTLDEERQKIEASHNKTTKRHKKKDQSGIDGSSEGPTCSGDGLSSEECILHSIKWDRIILDEAHYIKQRNSSTARAVLALESSYKWALSGTPLQNRVGELYSLVRFLQITPYSYYLCKDCDCQVLDYRPNSLCPNCPHKSVRHFCWWNKNVANPITSNGNLTDGKRAMILLKDKVLKSILLRRTKKGRAADLGLPPRIISLRRDYLDIKEEDYYTSLYNESRAQFNTYVDAGIVTNNYAHIFELLTRLRQAVDHPYLVVYSVSAAEKRESEAEAGASYGQVCGLCHEDMEDPVVTSCAHAFCKSCLLDYSDSVGEIKCPSCSKLLTVDFSTNEDQGHQNPKRTVKGFRSGSILNRIRLDDFQTSTKIDALKEEIRFMVERDGSAKGIVFSQFTAFLDLIHYSLEKSGVNCVQLVGSMSMGARDAAITKFTEDADCRIFLMSMKAGGVALNLTVASHVFLMDPWWNPAVERQAQDRIHRIGQFKPIRVVRFVIENTIEERILKLQDKKELVFEGTVGGSKEALGKLTEDDMRFLFAN